MRNHREATEYLSDPETKEKLRRVYHTKLKAREGFDDFFQDYAVHILEGRGQHQLLKHFAIDWLRKKTFYNRLKKTVPKFFSTDELTFTDEPQDGYLSEGYRKIVKDLADTYVGRTRIIVFLYYIYGMEQKEIGFVLNVSEARVSQMIKVIRRGGRLGDYIPEEEDIGMEEQREVDRLRQRNAELSRKLALAFRERTAKVAQDSTES